MNRIHVLVASVIVGLAAVFGLAAMAKTAGVGEAKPAVSKVSDQAIAAQTRKLNKAEVALRKARTQKPPPLPAVPKPVASAPRTRLVAQPAPSASSPSFSDDDHFDDDDHEEDDREHDD